MLDVKTIYNKLDILPNNVKNLIFSKIMGKVIPFSDKSKFRIERTIHF